MCFTPVYLLVFSHLDGKMGFSKSVREWQLFRTIFHNTPCTAAVRRSDFVVCPVYWAEIKSMYCICLLSASPSVGERPNCRYGSKISAAWWLYLKNKKSILNFLEVLNYKFLYVDQKHVYSFNRFMSFSIVLINFVTANCVISHLSKFQNKI